jgi:DNA-binding LacI/PurR family transcriptional regulator
MTTVTDVAKRANVSIATVSRVLNGSATVSPETRERVMRAVADLYYTPNKAARILSSGKSSTVAFAVSDIEQSEDATLTKYLQPSLQTIGLDFFLYNLSHSKDRLMRLLQEADCFGISAMVISSSEAIDEQELAHHAARLAEQNISLIMVDYDMSHLGIPSVVHDDESAAETAVKFLIETGRTPIAYLGRYATSRTGQRRRQGYVNALEKAGLPIDPDLTWDFYYRSTAGYEAVDRAIGRGLKFRAIQCGSDELAMGAIAALLDHKVSIPDEVAVIGFGNSTWASHLRPALTTLSSSPEQVATAVRDLLTGKGDMALRTVIQRNFLRRDSA